MDQELKAYLDGKFDAVDGKFDVIDGKFDAIDGKFDVINERLSAHDVKFAAMDKKFVELDEKFAIRIDASEARTRAYVMEELHKVETNLLHAFHGWARSMEIRVRGVAGLAMGFEERMSLTEERLSELERRRAS